MPKPYDATPKYLIDLQPSAWTKWFGYAGDDVKVCNVDLSTVTSSVDALLLVGRKKKEGLHLEFQSGYDAPIGIRLLVYSVLASKILNVPIRSVLLLLRPEADGPAMDGVVRRIRVDGTQYLEFHYEVVRVWKLSSDELANGELGTLPLAFIADCKPETIPGLVRRVARRLSREVDRAKAGEIWTAVKVLMGLKYEQAFIATVLKGESSMKDSVTYQAIVREGEEKGVAKGIERGMVIGTTSEARNILLRLGGKRFGKAEAKTVAAVNKIGSVERLEDLIERVYTVKSWHELFSK